MFPLKLGPCALVIGVTTRGYGAIAPQIFCIYSIFILCVERWYLKQNSIIHLKSNILPPTNFGLTTPLALVCVTEFSQVFSKFLVRGLVYIDTGTL